MAELLHPLAEKALHRSISPLIILDDPASIQEQIQIGLEIEALTRKIVTGEATIWEICEALEEYEEYSIDDWIDEIVWNMNYELGNFAEL